jgi:hypothetical protein
MSSGRRILRGGGLPWRTQGNAAFGRFRRKTAEGTRVVARTDAVIAAAPGQDGGTPGPGTARPGRPEDLHARGGSSS